mmetsp:Transcript_26001/g.84229  ORF Transcript_26001/g.84229 Transcript_26001/m.84229 type:complete len:237 (+) Transcript_26001:1087-1797(+)
MLVDDRVLVVAVFGVVVLRIILRRRRRRLNRVLRRHLRNLNCFLRRHVVAPISTTVGVLVPSSSPFDFLNLLAEAAALVEGQQRNHESDLHEEVDHHCDRAEAAEPGDVRDPRNRAREEGAEVGDSGDGNRRPGRPQRAHDAARGDVFDGLSRVEDAGRVVVQGRERRVVPRRIEEGVVDGVDDDERVVEADAEHHENRDGRAGGKAGACRQGKAEAGGRRHPDLFRQNQVSAGPR